MGQQPEHVQACAGSGTQRVLRGPPRRNPERRGTRQKWDVRDNRMPRDRYAAQKPTSAKARARLGRQLRRLAGDVVAARAGIQHAHTR
ncbi:UNVERIFIED_CONTAM: hypothetical protein Slati_2255800 [Sesamum latifolium]|uniref:Uncharacterized protein n=1 Tax=Sesamum latifolium TaxID=2727402 RepID=A0AAW2WZE2_9LAMI